MKGYKKIKNIDKITFITEHDYISKRSSEALSSRKNEKIALTQKNIGLPGLFSERQKSTEAISSDEGEIFVLEC
jgi:hypothetical protein